MGWDEIPRHAQNTCSIPFVHLICLCTASGWLYSSDKPEASFPKTQHAHVPIAFSRLLISFFGKLHPMRTPTLSLEGIVQSERLIRSKSCSAESLHDQVHDCSSHGSGGDRSWVTMVGIHSYDIAMVACCSAPSWPPC